MEAEIFRKQCAVRVCKSEIRECMGFVIAGDILEVEEGKRNPHEVREICVKHGVSFLDADPEYVKNNLLQDN